MLPFVESGEYGLISDFGNFSFNGLTADRLLSIFFSDMPECEESYNTILDVWTNSKGGFPEWIFEEVAVWVCNSWLNPQLWKN